MHVRHMHGHLSPSQSEPSAGKCLGEFHKSQLVQGVFPPFMAVSVAVYEKIPGKSPSICKSTCLNYPWVEEEITRESRKYFEMNDNENVTYSNLWGSCA